MSLTDPMRGGVGGEIFPRDSRSFLFIFDVVSRKTQRQTMLVNNSQLPFGPGAIPRSSRKS